MTALLHRLRAQLQTLLLAVLLPVLASTPAGAATVEDWLRATGPAQAHAQLQRLGEQHACWKVLGLLWQQPELIAPAARAMGINTTEQAAQLAQALADTLGQVRCDVLARLADPQPLPAGDHIGTMRRTNWADVRAAIKAQTLSDGIGWFGSDTTFALPSRQQLEYIAAVQPMRQLQWRDTLMDCDDFVQGFRGWLARHGLGNLAIGYASVSYYAGSAKLGQHAVAVSMDDTGRVWFIDPQTTGLHDPIASRLGGFVQATRALVTFVMH